MNLPNLFIAGFPKSGTTALADLLSQHPDVFLSPVKEPNFFCTDLAEESRLFHGRNLHYEIESTEDYAALFKTDKPIAIDASVSYIFSKTAPGRIYSHNPDSKVIVMIRNPVEMIESMYHHNVRTLDESAGSITEALDLEESRKRGDNIPKQVRFPSMLHYVEWSDYAGCMERYVNMFGNNLKIIFFEDFRDRRDLVLQEVCSFLGIDQEFEPTLRRKNPRKSARFVGLYSLFQNPGLKKLARSVIPLGIYHRIKDAIYAVFLKEDPGTPLAEEVASLVKERTAANVMAFHEYYNKRFLKKDIMGLWGY